MHKIPGALFALKHKSAKINLRGTAVTQEAICLEDPPERFTIEFEERPEGIVLLFHRVQR